MSTKPPRGATAAGSAASTAAAAQAAAVTALSIEKQTEELAQALLREYMHRRGFAKTLASFDRENPRGYTTISSRALMTNLMLLDVIQARNKLKGSDAAAAAPPSATSGGGVTAFSTIMEMLCDYRLRKRSVKQKRPAGSGAGELFLTAPACDPGNVQEYDSSDEEAAVRAAKDIRTAELDAKRARRAAAAAAKASRRGAAAHMPKATTPTKTGEAEREEPSTDAKEAKHHDERKARHKARTAAAAASQGSALDDGHHHVTPSSSDSFRRAAASSSGNPAAAASGSFDPLGLAAPAATTAAAAVAKAAVGRNWTPGGGPPPPDVGVSKSTSAATTSSMAASELPGQQNQIRFTAGAGMSLMANAGARRPMIPPDDLSNTAFPMMSSQSGISIRTQARMSSSMAAGGGGFQATAVSPDRNVVSSESFEDQSPPGDEPRMSYNPNAAASTGGLRKASAGEATADAPPSTVPSSLLRSAAVAPGFTSAAPSLTVPGKVLPVGSRDADAFHVGAGRTARRAGEVPLTNSPPSTGTSGTIQPDGGALLAPPAATLGHTSSRSKKVVIISDKTA